ncbi:oligosaccharide flippase family protein [Duganella sp. CY15W]|uniref:lipopolysaccharide biosynthesis protein n=1 Tax=Duganella sp. CY15W TaxID=2692172 RepID=UPI00136A18BD|nr:lipopolysaccharide biosynthesis protein [Duganella sp. CY15W]MYM32535.1 oligosaccharide flippase family protein [Duganella sp. CY15W]
MSLGRRSFWLGLSQMVELGLQVILPMVLVRHLTVAAFGDYRLVWLIASTAATMVPMGMPDTLALFLPREDRDGRRAHVAVTALYMVAAGLLTGLLVALGAALIGPSAEFRAMAWITGGFTALWVTGVMLDYLPVADERGDWQARVVIGVAVVRTTLASAAALAFGQVEYVFYALAISAALRLLLLLRYARVHHQLGSTLPSAAHWRRQVDRAWPLGLSSLMISARRQADQWIAAFLFGPVQFAVFSLGAVFGSLVLMMRRAVSSTFLPSMSKHEAGGDWQAVIDTNNRANLVVAFFAVPLLAFIWCFGEPIYTLIYTEKYVGAVAVMRILTVSWLLQIVELNSLIMLAGQMRYAVRIGGPLLLVSLLISFGAAYAFGLAGAAAGGVVMAFLERSLLLRQLSRTLQLPVGQLQSWGMLLAMLALSGALAALGRLAYEWRPLSMHPLLGMLLVGAVLPLPYFLVARKAGWLPHTLLATPALRQS